MRFFISQKKNKKLVFKLAILGIVAYVAAVFVNQRLLILKKQKKIAEMESQLLSQEVKIIQIKSELEAIALSDPSYLETIAHKDLNLSKKGERVFINIKGN